ncbi:MAG: hypothetical protein KA146_06790 [Leptospiraceae bacterium]|nr:hypothetical protein [Leptospiraceae bacterium]
MINITMEGPDFSGNMFREFANEKLSNNKEKYSKYSEFARKLNSGEFNLEFDGFLIDCLHQPYRRRKEYNHIDAYFISEILADYFNGNIMFAILRTADVAKRDKDKNLINQILASATPFHGEFIKYDSKFVGGKEYCDGYLDFEGKVKFINHQNDESEIENFSGLLEVGYTDISSTFVHLFCNRGQLARFPYGHKMIGLFIKTDYEQKMPDYSIEMPSMKNRKEN